MDWQGLAGALPGYGYLALFLILIVEGIGFPWVPYQPVFLAVAISVQAGGAELLPAVVIGSAGNLIGNLLGYWAGYTGGRRFAVRYGHLLGVGAHELAKVERWFGRWGGGVAFAARFIGLIRTPTILGAGIARMNFRTFALYSAVGGTIWCFLWLYGSMFFSNALIYLWDSQRELVYLLIAGSVLCVGGLLWWKARRRNDPESIDRNL